MKAHRFAAYVATRDPRGLVDHGRMAVIRTAISALASSYDHVVVYVATPASGATATPLPGNVDVTPLPDANSTQRLAKLLRHPMRPSLLGAGGLTDSQVDAIVADLDRRPHGPELLVLDGQRSAAALRFAGEVPVFIDLDDLLSNRYSEWADLSITGLPFDLILSRPQSTINDITRKLAPLLPAVLRNEARRSHEKELEICAIADAVSLVSPHEADILSQRSGRTIDCLPMSIRVPPTPARSSDTTFDAIFVGHLSFLPNLAGLDWFAARVKPELETRLRRPARVAVAGRASTDVDRWLRAKGYEPVGFVPELPSILATSAVAIAPQRVSGGVNTKVLDYLAHGMPVVGTRNAFAGLIGAAEGCFIAEDDPTAFAERMLEIIAEGGDAELGDAGRAYVNEHYRPELIEARWRDAFTSAPERIST